MTTWRACGLRFESDFDLRPLPHEAGTEKPDITVRRAEVSPDGIENPLLTRALAQIGNGCVWFDVPGIARFRVDDGHDIRVDPYPEADEKSIVLFLLGSALGAVLHQRGFLVLHANAVRVGDGVVLFAGASGVGKSTAAAAMLERGHQVLAADVTAINDSGEFAAGIPRLKSWQDVLGKMDTSLEGLERIRLQIDKYHLPMPVQEFGQPLAVRAIYILNTANEMKPGHFELKHLEGKNKFIVLKRQTYRSHFMQGMGLKSRHLKLCATLAQRTPIARIVRPSSRFNAPQLAERVLKDLRDLERDEAAANGRG